LCILLLYTSLINITQTVNVKEPSIQQYSKLYNLYDQALTCDCTQISINYGKFVQIQYIFHQVCNSDFVTQDWIDVLATAARTIGQSDDFRVTSPSAFQTLTAFCTLVNETISNSLTQFYSSQYVSASVTPENVFQSQTNVLISQFISSTTNEFLSSLSMIRKTTQSNSLVSGELTNYGFDLDRTLINLVSHSMSYGNCTCTSSATCVSASAFYDDNSNTLFVVPGFYMGCYIIEALLQSNLQCFYDQICIDEINSYYPVSSLTNVTALNMSLSKQFFENSTIEDVLDQLMVEQWNSSSIYENYYSECQPSKCSYTHMTKNSVIYIVTTIIGLTGGLITVLKLTVPRLVMFVRKKMEGRRADTGKIKSKIVLCTYLIEDNNARGKEIFSLVRAD
jgi:hypothetical protein